MASTSRSPAILVAAVENSRARRRTMALSSVGTPALASAPAHNGADLWISCDSRRSRRGTMAPLQLASTLAHDGAAACSTAVSFRRTQSRAPSANAAAVVLAHPLGRTYALSHSLWPPLPAVTAAVVTLAHTRSGCRCRCGGSRAPPAAVREAIAEGSVPPMSPQETSPRLSLPTKTSRPSSRRLSSAARTTVA